MRVLVIDDDICILDLATLAFQSQNWAVVTATSAEDGMVLVRESEPDVILLDLHMPDRNAEDAMKLLRQNAALRSIPVILMTADSNVDFEATERLGISGHISKPFDPRQLAHLVEAILQKGR